MHRTAWSYILILQSLIHFLQAIQPYNYIPSTNSGTNTLYNSTTPLALGSIITFNVNFPTPHRTNPKLMLGVIGYEERGDMIDSVFQLNLGTTTLATFTIEVMCAGTSAVYMFRISYISLEDVNNAFYCFWIPYTNLTVVSTGTATRTQAKTGNSFYTLSMGKQFNSNMSLNKAYVHIRGFEIQSVSGDFNLQVTVQITNAISFTTFIKTSSDCRIQNVHLMHIFVDMGKFTNQILFIYDQPLSFSEDNGVYEVPLPAHFSSFGHILMGFTRWKGRNVHGGAIITFNMANASATSLSLYANQNVIQVVQYNYVFLALNQCNSFYPYFTSSAKQACTTQCSSGEVQSPSSKICAACISPCRQCSIIATNCTLCVEKYQLSNFKCTIIPVSEDTSASTSSPLYLLALLSVIPIAIIFCCFLKKRRQKFKIHIADIVIQPSIDFT